VPTLGSTELIILLVVVLVLFGAKRLPDSARSLGRSMRILKAETKGLRDDSDTDLGTRDTTVTAQPLPPAGGQPTPGTAQPGAGQQAAPHDGEQAQHPRP
jgi:sec-independent protein translocase protein TatA